MARSTGVHDALRRADAPACGEWPDEVAVGALTGYPYAALRAAPDLAARSGVHAPDRIRQWHLDLIALGAMSVLAGTVSPTMPRWVAWSLGVGAWTNAMSFLPLAFRPQLERSSVFRGLVTASFTANAVGWTSLAVLTSTPAMAGIRTDRAGARFRHGVRSWRRRPSRGALPARDHDAYAAPRDRARTRCKDGQRCTGRHRNVRSLRMRAVPEPRRMRQRACRDDCTGAAFALGVRRVALAARADQPQARRGGPQGSRDSSVRRPSW